MRIFYIGKKRSFPDIKLCLPKTALPNGATDTDTVSKKWNLQVYEKGFLGLRMKTWPQRNIYTSRLIILYQTGGKKVLEMSAYAQS